MNISLVLKTLLATVISISVSTNLYGQQTKRLPPATKRIVDKAIKEVKKNLEECDRANQKPLGDARAELQELSTTLIKDGKTADATAVLAQIETLEADVMKMAKAEKETAPPNPPLQGAVAWKGHKYKFFADRMTWSEAKMKCEALGGYLVVVDSPAEQEFVARSLNSLPTKPDSVWCGVNRGLVPGEWITVKGKKVEFTNWMPGQPDHQHGQDNCVEFWREEGYRWNDRPETFRSPFICEWDE